MKLSEAFVTFTAESGTLNTEQSVATYRKTVRQLIDYCGDRALNSYTTAELTAFCLGDGGRASAPRTIAARRNRLRSLFAWCAYRKLVIKDPCADLKFTVKARGGGVREGRWLSKDETTTIAARFNLEDPRSHRDYVVYRTTLMLGLRRFEAAQLRWPMFRDDLSTVTVVGKGRKVATLAVPAKLRDVLAGWRRTQPEVAVPFPRFRRHYDFAGRVELVPLWDVPLGAAGIYEIVRRCAGVAPHDLRRSFAGILEADGMSLKDVQGLMRHDNLATTDVYLSNSPARLARAAEQVNWD